MRWNHHEEKEEKMFGKLTYGHGINVGGGAIP